MIGENRGLGAILSKGVRRAAQELGGGSEKFAVHGRGLEPPMHDPRSYASLGPGYSTSNRGACHVAGFSHTFERVVTMPEIGLPKSWIEWPRTARRICWPRVSTSWVCWIP